MMAIFELAFGRVAHIRGAGVPYAAFALSALVPWIFVQSAVSFSAESLVAQAALVRKVYFPRETVVLGAVLATVLDLGIGLILFIVVGPALGARVSFTWLLAPFISLAFIALAAAVGLFLAAPNAYYRDFRYALPFLLQFWLFASPIAYPLASVPAGLRWWYVAVNPAAGLLDSMRRVLTVGAMPRASFLGIGLLGTALWLVVGFAVLKRLEPSIGDVM